jgi:hypothetical protein
MATVRRWAEFTHGKGALMNRIPASLRKAILVMLLLAAATFVVMSAPVSEAAGGTNCTYYSDASYTTVVGQFGYDCCNNPVAWGIKTAYAQCSSACFICYPPPR